MKWLAMLLSLVFGRATRSRGPTLKETALEIFNEVIHESRKFITLTMGALAAVLIFCAGFFIALLNGTTQYDRGGSVAWTATLGAGVVLMLLAIAIFGVIFLRAWPGIKQRRIAKQKREESRLYHEAAPLETALSLLVMDFIKEREERRAVARGETPSSSPATSEEEAKLRRVRTEKEKAAGTTYH